MPLRLIRLRNAITSLLLLLFPLLQTAAVAEPSSAQCSLSDTPAPHQQKAQARTMQARMPTMFVTHGGGPMPLLGDRLHLPLSQFLRGAASHLPARPKAILMTTAHWETSLPTVSTSPHPPMLYDYGGFPPESYQVQYPAPGPSPDLVDRVKQLLGGAGIPLQEDGKRGYDHGTFVPLKLMFPDADIPVLQMSIMESLDPELHYKVGEALAPLRDEGVLLLASGSSFHNMRSFMGLLSSGGELPPNHPALAVAKAFDDWLTDACTQHKGEARLDKLKAWAKAPGGRESHPREEHLIPLMVAAGAAGEDAGQAVHQFTMGVNGRGLPVSSFLFG